MCVFFPCRRLCQLASLQGVFTAMEKSRGRWRRVDEQTGANWELLDTCSMMMMMMAIMQVTGARTHAGSVTDEASEHDTVGALTLYGL